jgi:ABC-type dipeptide/oligopeptide/nickel transport system permease component
MLQYIIRRIVQFIPVFFGVTLILFLVTTVLPGDPLQMKVGEKTIPKEQRARMLHEYGLDKPWYEQYAIYLGKLAQGDLGQSFASGQRVTKIISETYPYTVQLALVAIMIEVVIGLAAGIISAVKQYTFWDVLVTVATAVSVSLPVFWLGILLQFTFGIWLKDVTNGNFYLPISGVGGPGAPFPDAAYYILPAITLAAVSTAYVARIMRSQLLEVQSQDYVRTAYAKGLSSRAVLTRHQMKNALIPVVTFIGLDLGAMLAGAILTETVFNWPGIGYTIYRAIIARDYPVVFGGTIVILFAVMIVNLLTDISYAFLDPRIRYGNAGNE